MVLLDEATIRFLIDHRDASKHATFFIDPVTGFPEPLLTLFEPSIFPVLKAAHHAGQHSLNRILRECNGNALIPPKPEVLKSFDFPQS
jgi:molybdopterin-guanine dinucleotide biosynthesis protein A